MMVQQSADPILGTTYAGFAASRANEQKDGLDLRLSGEARTYDRAELRRRSRRGRGPAAAVAVLAVVAVSATVGAALIYEPNAELAPPPPPAAAPVAGAMSAPAEDSAAPSSDAAGPELPTVQPVGDAVALPPVARAAVFPKAPPSAKPAARSRSSAQAAADRAATDRVSALAALDQEVNKAYAGALNAGAPVGPLTSAQASWIIRRDRLRREDPDMAEDLVRARIAELHGIAAQSAADAQGTQ